MGIYCVGAAVCQGVAHDSSAHLLGAPARSSPSLCSGSGPEVGGECRLGGQPAPSSLDPVKASGRGLTTEAGTTRTIEPRSRESLGARVAPTPHRPDEDFVFSFRSRTPSIR